MYVPDFTQNEFRIFLTIIKKKLKKLKKFADYQCIFDYICDIFEIKINMFF